MGLRDLLSVRRGEKNKNEASSSGAKTLDEPNGGAVTTSALNENIEQPNFGAPAESLALPLPPKVAPSPPRIHGQGDDAAATAGPKPVDGGVVIGAEVGGGVVVLTGGGAAAAAGFFPGGRMSWSGATRPTPPVLSFSFSFSLLSSLSLPLSLLFSFFRLESYGQSRGTFTNTMMPHAVK